MAFEVAYNVARPKPIMSANLKHNKRLQKYSNTAVRKH